MNGYQYVAAQRHRDRLWKKHINGHHEKITEGCELCGRQIAEWARHLYWTDPRPVHLFFKASEGYPPEVRA